MGNYYRSFTTLIHEGAFQEKLVFNPGLNIISGENGTFKTKTLQQMRANQHMGDYDVGQPLPMVAISPKRNAQRKAMESIIEEFRQNRTTSDIFQQQRLQASINDSTFEPYPSLAETYLALFQSRIKDGSDQRTHMDKLTVEFNEIIKSIFNNYELISVWNRDTGNPRIQMKKGEGVVFPIEGLSLGEQDVLALVVSLYASKEATDVFLIDEPESHLNWHLEEKLFDYFDNFCKVFEKQIIVVTHSRVIFKEKYSEKTLFFYWSNEEKVEVSNDIPLEQRLRLAGEVLEVSTPIKTHLPYFFVEDESHKEFLEIYAKILDRQLDYINVCGNSSNVKSIYSSSQMRLENTYFIIDGDNQGNPYPSDKKFIHLPVYCIENYFIDPDVISIILEIEVMSVQKILKEIILLQRERMKQNPNLHFMLELIDVILPENLTFQRLAKFDGSKILSPLCQKLGIEKKKYIEQYLRHCFEMKKARSIFPAILLDAIEKAPSVVKAGVDVEHSDPHTGL
jgi:AAA domain, putative AbiEii toxin, Type IV TA system/Protein of unknown function (DUF4435)